MEDILEKARQLSVLKLSQKTPSYKRFLYNALKNTKAKIIGIYGARGVGKTTLMIQLLKSLNLNVREAIYISCDHPLFTDINLFEFLDEFYKKGGKIIFIDEIHKIKDFYKHIKSAYDFLNLRIYFSGSSAISITDPDFSRRFSMYKLPILSLREYIEIAYNKKLKPYTLEDILKNHETIAQNIITSTDQKILKLYDEYLNFGAYPFYFEDPDKYIDKLTDMINASLYYDIGEIFNVSSEKIHSLKKLLSTICVSKPLELSVEKLANISGITKSTLYKYIDYLVKTQLVIHISHEAKRFKALRKPDKLYLANPNLFNALCLEQDKGTIRETFFVSLLSYNHRLHYLDKGDFLIDEKYVFEIGGRKKDYSQIEGLKNSYLAIDDVEIGFERKIPLWLFGFLY